MPACGSIFIVHLKHTPNHLQFQIMAKEFLIFKDKIGQSQKKAYPWEHCSACFSSMKNLELWKNPYVMKKQFTIKTLRPRI